METDLAIEIGCEKLHIVLKHCDRKFSNTIKGHLSAYITQPDQSGCQVKILFYRRKRPYAWDLSEIRHLEQTLRTVHLRHPTVENTEEKVVQSLRILRQFDPDENNMRRMRALLTGPVEPVNAIAGADLFLYNRPSNTAYFLLKKRFRHANKLTGVLNGLMFVLSQLLIHSGGLLLHGAAVQRDNLTVLFLGLSGAGKTTVARLCQPDICFSDDGVIIRDQGNRFFVYYSPFRQIEENGNTCSGQKGEIKKIFLLEKNSSPGVSTIKKNELMQLILLHHIHYFKYLDRETACKGFYRVKNMMESIPAYRLRFNRSEEIWDRLSDL